MARFLQLINPILTQPTPGRSIFGRPTARLLSNLLAWALVICSFYFCITGESTLLLGIATVQIGFGLLLLLESILKRILDDPLKSRRLEMTGYCVGGLVLLLLCIYQFSEAYLSLQRPVIHRNFGVMPAVISSITGNLVLVRLLWRSGLIRPRIRVFCRPLLGLLLLNLLSLLSSLLIQLTQYASLDALMGMASSIVLFLLTAGIMLDAYWHLTDLEMKGLKNNELAPP